MSAKILSRAITQIAYRAMLGLHPLPSRCRRARSGGSQVYPVAFVCAPVFAPDVLGVFNAYMRCQNVKVMIERQADFGRHGARVAAIALGCPEGDSRSFDRRGGNRQHENKSPLPGVNQSLDCWLKT